MSEFELRQRLRALRLDQEPARDLWPAIAARLGDPAAVPAPTVAVPPRRRLAAWPEALAAMLVVALGAGAMLLGEAPAPADPAPALAVATPWTLREAQGIDLSYQAALDTAGPRVPQQRPQDLLAAETELDAAQVSIERALRENPGSTHLLKLLQQTHEQRLRLYRREQLVG